MAVKRAKLADSLGSLARHVAPKGEGSATEPGAAPAENSGGKTRADAMKGFRYMQVRINEDGWEELQNLRIAQRRSVQALAIEALNDLLAKYGRHQVVKGPAE